MPCVFRMLTTIKAIILAKLTFNANTFKTPGWLFGRKLKNQPKIHLEGKKNQDTLEEKQKLELYTTKYQDLI